MLPSLMRPSLHLDFKRETLPTPDDDFIDIDWVFRKIHSTKLAILVHGLECSSKSFYMTNTMKLLNNWGADTVGMNFRGCSGRMNKLLKTYHSGKSEDLALVVDHILKNYSYETIYLIGFSVGGSIVIKYLGELADKVSPRIRKAVAFSAPIDLLSVANALAKPQGKIYMQYFLHKLHNKIKNKMKQFPEFINDKAFKYIETFHEYDELYTAPLNGFKDADEYWAKASAKPFLPLIKVPTLLYAAADDPFLGFECYPYEIKNPYLELKISNTGGHMGFWRFTPGLNFYYEKVLIDYLSKI